MILLLVIVLTCEPLHHLFKCYGIYIIFDNFTLKAGGSISTAKRNL